MRERNIRAIATPRKEPDLDTFVSALLALATERLRAEREEKGREGTQRPALSDGRPARILKA